MVNILAKFAVYAPAAKSIQPYFWPVFAVFFCCWKICSGTQNVVQWEKMS